jgi:hypothetical protein
MGEAFSVGGAEAGEAGDDETGLAGEDCRREGTERPFPPDLSGDIR